MSGDKIRDHIEAYNLFHNHARTPIFWQTFNKYSSETAPRGERLSEYEKGLSAAYSRNCNSVWKIYPYNGAAISLRQSIVGFARTHSKDPVRSHLFACFSGRSTRSRGQLPSIPTA